jgi:hypothetical protein
MVTLRKAVEQYDFVRACSPTALALPPLRRHYTRGHRRPRTVCGLSPAAIQGVQGPLGVQRCTTLPLAVAVYASGLFLHS